MLQIEQIKEKFSQNSSLSDVIYGSIYNYDCIEIHKQQILAVCKILKDEYAFDQLIDIIGVDRFTKNDRFEVIYNLWSNTSNSRLFIRVKLDSKKPEIETVSSIWSTANWEEREAFDMFGIKFLNHPDLRRIYMMDEFEYYPLRKDYPLMGIPGAVELPKK